MHFAGDSVTCTLEHPFFVNNDWVAARELKAGDSLFCFSGEKVKIDSVHKFKTDTATAVYNLESSGNHNYYVSASKVLVHNTCLPKLGRPKLDALNMAEASAQDLMDYANAYSNLYKIGEVQEMTRDQVAYFVKLLRKNKIKVRIDKPHPNTNWNIDHLNVGPEGRAHIPIKGR